MARHGGIHACGQTLPHTYTPNLPHTPVLIFTFQPLLSHTQALLLEGNTWNTAIKHPGCSTRMCSPIPMWMMEVHVQTHMHPQRDPERLSQQHTAHSERMLLLLKRGSGALLPYRRTRSLFDSAQTRLGHAEGLCNRGTQGNAPHPLVTEE